MKQSIVLSTHQTSFDALAFSGDLHGNLARIASYGYDGVELAVRDPLSVNAGEIEEMASSLGLEVPAIGTGQVWNDDGLSLTSESLTVRKRALERLFGHVDLAAHLHATLIIGLVRGVIRGIPTAETTKLLLNGLGTLAERAKRSGVKIAVEPINRYETSLINSASEGMTLLSQLDAQNVGLLLDTFHMNIEEPSIEESVYMSSANIFHFHVADSNRWYPGSGHLDFPNILRTLSETGYNGYVSGEFLPLPSAEEAARLSFKAMKHWLATIPTTASEPSRGGDR